MKSRKIMVASALAAALLAPAGCGSAEREKTPKITGGAAGKFDPNETPAGRGAPGGSPAGKGGGATTAGGLNKK